MWGGEGGRGDVGRQENKKQTSLLATRGQTRALDFKQKQRSRGDFFNWRTRYTEYAGVHFHKPCCHASNKRKYPKHSWSLSRDQFSGAWCSMQVDFRQEKSIDSSTTCATSLSCQVSPANIRRMKTSRSYGTYMKRRIGHPKHTGTEFSSNESAPRPFGPGFLSLMIALSSCKLGQRRSARGQQVGAQ
jgi:hypothetical protein